MLLRSKRLASELSFPPEKSLDSSSLVLASIAAVGTDGGRSQWDRGPQTVDFSHQSETLSLGLTDLEVPDASPIAPFSFVFPVVVHRIEILISLRGSLVVCP
jgi:hypothetical protein